MRFWNGKDVMGVPLPNLMRREEVPPQPQETPHDSDALLLQFLKDHEIACPLCGYNLRHITAPRTGGCSR